MCLTRAMRLSAGCELVGAQQVAAPSELVEHELQPELGGLVLDDEQQFVVMRGVAQRLLRAEQVVEVEVVAVESSAAEVGDDVRIEAPRVVVDGHRPSVVLLRRPDAPG